ncbi:MAG: hypothetical protein ACRCX7_09945 [Cetobacterium sp.]|uniref:hypothetical protein n=1 Tax=Cetobacterium sp. TaxID=2071632 RepID=UPI003F3C69BD
MTLEELRSRLIEVCKGKEKFVKALEMISERVNGGCWRFNSCREINELYEQPNYVLDCPPDLDCGDCPMNDFRHIEGIDCRCPNLHIPNMEVDELREFANETLNLAIASCKGEEVKVEVEEVPVDNPSKPLFIVTKVDDLIGLESEDGKLRIVDSVESAMLYVIGISTHHMYLDFMKGNSFNDEVVACLEELGFRFIIERKKSYLELLEECEEVEFNVGEENWYVSANYGNSKEDIKVEDGYFIRAFIPGIKYISREDADRIVKECAENA